MGAANRELAVVHHSANRHAIELVELFERLAPRAAARTASFRELARLVRVQWQTDERAISMGLEAGELRDELVAARGRVAELEPLTAQLESARAACAETEHRLLDVLGQRRVRLGIALARPFDLLRRRRR